MTIFAARKRFADKVRLIMIKNPKLMHNWLTVMILSQVMWIMDKVFLVTNFGWVSWMHDDFFILAVSSSHVFQCEITRALVN